jgi:acetate CoA/acetoacetate CoA-transferase alpha subunit
LDKITSVNDAVDHVRDGMTVMVGGFLGNGSPETLINALVKKGVKNLTLICNDTAFPDKGVGKMISSKQFKKVIVSHAGTNPETSRQFNNNELDCVFVPQGTLAEQVRSGGTGLGGVLTPTGVGTIVEEGKQKLEVDRCEYLLELPLWADVALIYGSVVDKTGNVVYEYSQRNFNPLMAMAADVVICEAGMIVDEGGMSPEAVITPGIFVDYVVLEGSDRGWF